jgi:hypothetical protein
MASLKDLPPRPRSTSTVPAYPRRVLLGAITLVASVAACTPADEPHASGHLDEAQVEGTGGSTASQRSTTANTTQKSDFTGYGGQMAGAMPEPWNEGGGGTGGAPTTITGEGGGGSGGAPTTITGEGGGAAPDPWEEGGGGSAPSGAGGQGGASFDGGIPEPWGTGGASQG